MIDVLRVASVSEAHDHVLERLQSQLKAEQLGLAGAGGMIVFCVLAMCFLTLWILFGIIGGIGIANGNDRDAGSAGGLCIMFGLGAIFPFIWSLRSCLRAKRRSVEHTKEIARLEVAIGEVVTVKDVVLTREVVKASSDLVRDHEEAATAETKTCPSCAETIKAAARKCRYCGHQFAPLDEQAK